ncbi:MAG: 2-dehydropantoate 2-reductase [Candidatus Endobugula sp.]|jgi:2-dehydropantoate 2-reductase
MATSGCDPHCVKAFQLSALCQTLAQHKHNDKPIVLVMNVMGLVKIVTDILPKTRVFQASFVQGALLNQAQANHTSEKHTGNGTTHIGDLLGVCEHIHIEPIMSGLNHALPVDSWYEDSQETMLLKVCINAIVNPVTGLKGIKNGGIIVNEKLDSLAQTLFNNCHH